MLRPLVTLVYVILATALIGILAILVALLFTSGKPLTEVGRWWAKSILWVAGVRYAVKGKIPSGSPYLFMANHQSNLDVLCLVALLPAPINFVAKSSLRWIPILGWVMMAGGIVFIRRERRHQAIKSLDQAAVKIRSGFNVVVFPEGTRSRDGTLGPFKKGPFYLACVARVPTVPIGIVGSHALLPPGSILLRAGEVQINFGFPITVAADADVESLRTRVRDKIAALRNGG